ncbi:glutamic acid-rich protein-like [Dreissena polymorpha]|uniref:glutamic acid-rich protein-like n=1 Tax=Dreissena polymorpha TaxID=45954 RepID=UPI002263B2F2|nr:glutamic acid-rich protein-like [Dreissena polymorpha]
MECSKEQENATILLNPPQRSHEVNNDKIISHTTENNADNTNHTGEFTNDKFSKNEHNENDDDDDDNSSETEESNDEEGDEKDDDDDKHDSSEKEEQEELKETNILLLPTKSSQTFSLSITEHVNSSASSDTQSDGTVNLDKTAVKTSETEEISVTIDTNVNLENVNYTVIIRHTKEDTGDPKDHDAEGIIDMFSESENNKVYDDGDISSETEETDENGGIEDDDDYEEDYDDYFEDDEDDDDDDDYYENNDGEDSEDSSETNEANEGDVEMGTLEQKDQKEEDVIKLNPSIVNGRVDDVHIAKIANVTKDTEDELVETVLLQGVPVESNEASSTGYNTATI